MADAPPYRSDLTVGPTLDTAWLRTSDGVRLRVGHVKGVSAEGTVVLLPGRTEYLEKYGHTHAALTEAGFDVISIDWRGQGLSDRVTANPMVGHVAGFSDFQKDWAAFMAYARAQSLPRPWHMLAHSMGGCIGLRALISGADIASVVFSGPMWGITMAPYLRPVAWTVPRLACALGLGHLLSPGTSIKSYMYEPFENNLLTTDPEMFAWMKQQVAMEPRFGLGGPSLAWLKTALTECDALAELPSPAIPALCFVGANERIVHMGRIRDRMKSWPGGKLLLVDGAEHEVLMEGENIRRQVTGSAIALFSRLA